jgi:hypothetical protein
MALQAIESSTTHNERHPRAPDSKGLSPSVPEVVAEDREFSRKYGIYGGLKNRRLRARKSSSTQVLVSRTLSVCGEVAERLKAAVC